MSCIFWSTQFSCKLETQPTMTSPIFDKQINMTPRKIKFKKNYISSKIYYSDPHFNKLISLGYREYLNHLIYSVIFVIFRRTKIPIVFYTVNKEPSLKYILYIFFLLFSSLLQHAFSLSSSYSNVLTAAYLF
jgi:hypothetical protein